MLRNVVSAAIFLAVGVGLGLAEEIRGVITKVDGKNVTFAESKGKGERGAEKTMAVADNVKILKGKYNQETKKLDAGDPLEGGLKNEALTRIDEKGVRATVITDGGKITEIRIGGRRGKN